MMTMALILRQQQHLQHLRQHLQLQQHHKVTNNNSNSNSNSNSPHNKNRNPRAQ